MDPAQLRRIAHNESLFRRINEQTVTALDEFHGDDAEEVLTVMCECALRQCQDMVDVPAETYHRVRSNPTWFVVRPEHVMAAAEHSVEQREDYWIVSKVGVGAEVARDEDGR